MTGPTSWSKFLRNIFTKALDPSLGVNQMWTKSNDHAPKVNVLIFNFFNFFYMSKKGRFEKNKV